MDLRIQQPFNYPMLHMEVDRTKANQVGFTQRDVAQNLLIALSGSTQTAPSYWLDLRTGVTYNVATQTPQYRMNTPQDLENIPVANASAGKVTPQILGSLASFSRGAEMGVVTHYDIESAIDIFGAVDGRDLGGVAREMTPSSTKTRRICPPDRASSSAARLRR